MTDDLKVAFGEPVVPAGTYHDDGWWSDLGQVRAAMITFALAVICFAVTVLLYYRPASSTPVGAKGTVTNAATGLGGLFSLLTFVLSIIGIGVGIFISDENRHRVRRLGRTFAALSAANLIAFIVFAVITASFKK